MRYSVQRYGTWEWLDYEAPLVTTDGPEWCRSTFGIMSATIPSPVVYRGVASDGRDVFEEWGTFIHAEIDDPGRTRRVWTAIVTSATLGKSGWELTLTEHPGYLKGVPYQGIIRGVNEDPANLLRQLVADTQAMPGGWYGCTVTGTTPVRVGSDLDDRIAAARAVMDARKVQLDSFSKTSREKTKELQDVDATLADEVAAARSLVAQAQQQVAELIRDGAPSSQIDTAVSVVTARQATYTAALAGYNAEVAAGRAALASAKSTREVAQKAYDTAKDAYDALRERRKDGEGAFVIDGAELPDTFAVFQDLCETVSIEWTTTTRYTEGAPEVGIVLQYPRVGSRRDDLVFDTGVNILAPLELDRTDFHNAAAGIGAGEGKVAIRRNMNVPSLRMRRPATVEDKSAKTNARLDAAMRAVLRASTGELFPTQIDVRDHPNCPIGSWRPGDIITVTGVTTIGSRWSGLARVESWSWPSPHRARLRLSPP